MKLSWYRDFRIEADKFAAMFMIYRHISG
jgi:hypothetical protein